MSNYVGIEQRFKEIYAILEKLGQGNYSLRPADVGLSALAPTRRATIEEAKQGKSSLVFLTPQTGLELVKANVVDQGVIDGYIDALYDALKEGAEKIRKA